MTEIGDDIKPAKEVFMDVNEKSAGFNKAIEREPNAATFRNKYGVLLDRLSAEGKAQAGQKRQAEQWKSQGLCPHCGGTLKGLFKKKCTECGKTPSEAIITSAAPVQPNYPVEPKIPQTSTHTSRRLEATDLLSDVVASIKGEFVFVNLGGIEWRVLAVENNKALLISEIILEKRPYNVEPKDITWENCTLRKYLNTEFYNKLGKVKSAIAETRNSNPNNQWYGTAGGNVTTDEVFLLSLDELVKYLGDSGDFVNKRRKDRYGNAKNDGYFHYDQYNNARMAKYSNGEEGVWWLRSPGMDNDCVASVHWDGVVMVDGRGVDESDCVRPALWLNL